MYREGLLRGKKRERERECGGVGRGGVGAGGGWGEKREKVVMGGGRWRGVATQRFAA